ncbi:MAG TPA: DnaB-like helicase C-terminal domain-containing protein [Gemmatimonadaceae bacterium]|jgi:replicative DNA helicase
MTRTTDISPLSVLLSRVDAVSDGAPPPWTVATGFASVDKMLGGGLRQGDLVVIGGDTASGKSALSLAFAIRMSLASARVLFLTAEMSAERVLERIIAIEARTKIDDLRQGTLDDMARANAGSVALRLRENLPVVDCPPPGGVAAIASMLDGLPLTEIVFVDSLSATVFGDALLDEALARAVKDLKTLAVERHVVIVTTAAVRDLGARADRRPVLEDFDARGAVKEHADVVMALFREQMYQPGRDVEGATELIVRKNRNGPTGYVDLFFYAQWMRFEDMLDPER